MTMDAIALLGLAMFELSQLHREDITPHLHKDYGDLCSVNVPVKEPLPTFELLIRLTTLRAPPVIQGVTIMAKASARMGLNNTSGLFY